MLGKMPPLLAALLMIELGCTLGMVEAIDLGVEWRMHYDTHAHSRAWYSGYAGRTGSHLVRGTYAWPVIWSPKRF